MNIVIKLSENEIQRILNGTEVIFPMNLGNYNADAIVIKRKENY